MVWGAREDPTTDAVLGALGALGAEVALVDDRRLVDGRVTLRLERGCPAGDVLVDGTALALGDVEAAFLRPHGPRHATAASLLLDWADATPVPVLNPPVAIAVNDTKPWQAMLARRHGFAVPATLCTNDPAAALAFRRRHGAVVFKSTSGTRSVVARLGRADEPRLADLGTCPVQFQQYVAGDDHRVHVIGDEVVTVQVRCDADDYRYAGPSPVEISETSLPRDVEDRCRSLAAAQGLLLAGIDLRRSPEGAWFFLEANPCPAFAVFDPGGRVARSVARLLNRADATHERRPTNHHVKADRRTKTTTKVMRTVSTNPETDPPSDSSAITT